MSQSLLQRPLMHVFEVAGLKFQECSDLHFDPNQPEVLAKWLIAQLRDDVDAIVFAGDLLNAPHGEATQRQNGDIWRDVSKEVERRRTGQKIFAGPGNHCLRGSGDSAWGNFGALPSNVYAPLENPIQPVVVSSKVGDIVLANNFYDFKLLDPALLGLSEDGIREFYKTLPDGKHLLGGKTDMFPEMADNFARAITPDVAVVITHCILYPSQAEFKVLVRTPEVEKTQADFGVPFICDPDGDREEALQLEYPSVEAYLDRWNKKTFAMGTDIFSRRGANPRDGLVVISGHNHRAEDRVIRHVGGKDMIFCSYQFPFSRPEFKWDRSGSSDEIHP